MGFVYFGKLFITLFNISIIAAATPPIGTDGYKFTTSGKVCFSLDETFHSYASPTNKDDFETLYKPEKKLPHESSRSNYKIKYSIYRHRKKMALRNI